MRKKRLLVLLFAAALASLVCVSQSPGQETWTIYDNSNTSFFSVDSTFYSVAIDRSGKLWVGNRPSASAGTGRVFKFDGTAWTKALDIDGGDKMWAIFVDSKNSVWIGTAGKGVYKYDGSKWAHIVADVNTADGVDSLGGNWVKQINEDASGVIWFACGPQTSPLSDDNLTPGVGGLTKFEPSTSKFTKYLSNYNAGNNVGGGNCNLANNWVTAVACDASGNVWAGTKGSGVSKFNPATNTWTTYTTPSLGNNTIGAGAIHYAPATKRIWIGTLSGVSWTINGSSWGQIAELTPYRIWSIESDWTGKLWISHPEPTASATGLYRYDSLGTTQLNHWDNTSGLPDNLVRRICVDNNAGKVWCATGGAMAVLSGVLPPKPATAVESDVVTPITFRVFQNYPNPFNPATVIEFALEKPADVELTIFALSGQTVRTLVSGNMPAGVHAVRWDGRDDSGKRVSSATYFYRLQTERDGAVVKKALLVK
jgi:ligand-binding sensor domain-containing protein